MKTSTFRIRTVISSIICGIVMLLSGPLVSANAIRPCPYPVSSSPAAGTTEVSSTPLSFDTTDGDILDGAAYTISGVSYLAFGGNFKNVVTPNGVKYPAENFAIINQASGAVVYGGKGINSYVRAVDYSGGVLYAGGDFMTFNGVPRQYIAAVSATTGALTSWNPGSSSSIHAIAASVNTIYYGGAPGVLRAVKPITGTVVWSTPVSGGPIASLLLSPGQSGLYVGGLFESVAGEARHGLMEVYAANGQAVPAFKPVLKADTGTGAQGSYNGQEGLSLAWDAAYTPARLVLGYGGASSNGAMSLSAATGVASWNRQTEGDAQAVAVVGNIYLTGYHRNHDNNIGCDYPYYATAFAAPTGSIQTYWNPRLSGNQPNLDGGNNGVQDILVNATTKRVFVLGGFTRYNATCNFSVPSCTGGTGRQSIAVYTYN